MQAQKRCLRSFDDPLLPTQTPRKGFWKHIGGQSPVEKGDDHGRGQLDGRFLDREHHPGVLSAVAVVIVISRRAGLGGMIVPITGRKPVLLHMVGGVTVTRPVGVNMGSRLALAIRIWNLARDADGEPRVEIAATERHRHREQDGHEKPEWTAAGKHTALEYTSLLGTTLRS